MSSIFFKRSDNKPVQYKLVIDEDGKKHWLTSRDTEDKEWAPLDGEPTCKLIPTGSIQAY